MFSRDITAVHQCYSYSDAFNNQNINNSTLIDPCLKAIHWSLQVWKSQCRWVEYSTVVPCLGRNYGIDQTWNDVRQMWNFLGEHVMSNMARARSLWYSHDSVFWLVQMTMWVLKLRNLSPTVGPNVISEQNRTEQILFHVSYTVSCDITYYSTASAEPF